MRWFEMMQYKGLSSEEVLKRTAAGLSNRVEKVEQKSIKRIIFEQTFTLFNIYLIVIAIALIAIQEYLSVFFLNVMIMNIFIQSYQIIRSIKMVDNLNLLVAQHTTCIRDGVEVQVHNEELVMDDIVYFKTGDQISSDAIVLGESVEMNESMLTGESKSVAKAEGDLLLSGSFVSSGSCYAKVIRVGKDNYVTKLMIEAKKFKEVRSELMDTFNNVANTFAKIVIPIGLILMVQSLFFRHHTIAHSITTTSTVLLGLLPKGLVLLTSISFAVSVFRLGRKRTLVQSIYSIETLSKVDVICIDKTGTLTEGKMRVNDVELVGDETLVLNLLQTYLHYSNDIDSTTLALKEHYASIASYDLERKLAFSSTRKWGAMAFSDQFPVFLGAPDFLMPDQPLPRKIAQEQEAGSRILLFAQSRTSLVDFEDYKNLECLAYIAIEDPLRDDAHATLEFFNNNDVQIKVISGDHIKTLLAVASIAGIQKGDSAIDVSSLTTDEELEEAVMKYNVIGRASPYQKQIMVKMLQKNNLKVAMVGDGVNDVLALRSADCSIAMGAGSSAAIQIAEVVLLDNSFATMVDVVMEGRTVTNNIARSASMYYLGTLTIFVLCMVSIITNTPFPFIPIQMTIMSMFVEGMPSTLVTFESSYDKPKEKILRQVSRNIVPVGFTLVVAYLIVLNFDLDYIIKQTMLYYITIFLSYMLVIKVFKPMNARRILVLLLSSSILVTICVIFANLLNLTVLDWNQTIMNAAMIGFSLGLWHVSDILYNVLLPNKYR